MSSLLKAARNRTAFRRTALQAPSLTVLAVEEPENHLAPHYLGRIMKLLRHMAGSPSGQVLLSSHSPSIMRRVEPEWVRYLRLDPDSHESVVKPIDLPPDTSEPHKFVRQAVLAYPELYFARAVVLGEGDSEEIVLPRIAESLGVPVDTSFVSIVPLGGRHVNHFWRLLKGLDIPYVTLLDLDRERAGGGWGRIKYVLEQLIENGAPKDELLRVVDKDGVLYVMSDKELAEMHLRDVTDSDRLLGWITYLEHHGVYFSIPLDLDFMMLGKFPLEYQATADRGPRIPDADDPKRDEATKEAVTAVLKKGTDGSTYSDAERGYFFWYRYLFLGRAKPTTHILALASIDDAALAKHCPKPLLRLVAKVKELLGLKEGAGCRECSCLRNGRRSMCLSLSRRSKTPYARRRTPWSSPARGRAKPSCSPSGPATCFRRTCAAPRRILAISFKRDAARNLSDRVARRCNLELARRFDSRTFDAFAKSLLDRFSRGLPPLWRPSDDYQVNFEIREKRARDYLDSIPNRPGLSKADIAGISPIAFYRNQFVGKLPIDAAPTTVEERASLALWHIYLRGYKPSTLNFEMIDRLAELLLRVNPKIVAALRETYSFVFLDEFQDTTTIQYELIKTAFLGSQAILTAVGDNKQRIMGWANALPGIFAKFQADFGAAVIRPVRNYRSAPQLVRIQQFIAKALDKEHQLATPVDDGKDGEGECRLFEYPNHLVESEHLATLIEGWIKTDGITPREICVLVRLLPQKYTTELTDALARRSIKARVESELIDLIAEPITTAVLHFFKLATARRAPDSWAALMDLLQDLDADDSDERARDRERRLAGFIRSLRHKLKATLANDEAVLGVVTEVISFIGDAAYIALYPQYGQGTFFRECIGLIAKNLATSRANVDWRDAIEIFEGKDSVPIMTMHKSKGLEYHTIVFVGLEDSALFGFKQNEFDEACGFFVGSRERRSVRSSRSVR